LTDIGHLTADAANAGKFIRASLAAALQNQVFMASNLVVSKQSAFVLKRGVSAIAHAAVAIQARSNTL